MIILFYTSHKFTCKMGFGVKMSCNRVWFLWDRLITSFVTSFLSLPNQLNILHFLLQINQICLKTYIKKIIQKFKQTELKCFWLFHILMIRLYLILLHIFFYSVKGRQIKFLCQSHDIHNIWTNHLVLFKYLK